MAERRMLNRRLALSDKFYSVSDRARWIYVLGLPFTDRDGLLPHSSRELSQLYLGSLCNSWEQIEEARDELVRCGLWEHRTDLDGRECVHVYRFDDFQDLRHYERESVSAYRFDTCVGPGVGPGSSPGSGPGPGPGVGPGSDPAKIRKEEIRLVEMRGASTPSKIQAAYGKAMELEGVVVVPKPRDREIIQEAERIGTADAFKDHDELVAEFRRVYKRLKEHGYPTTLKALVNNLGSDWADRSCHRSGPLYPDASDALRRMADEAGISIEDAMLAAERNGDDPACAPRG